MFNWLESTRVLSLICFLPLAGAGAVLLVFRRHQTTALRRFAAGVALLDLLLALPLWFAFERDGPPFQFRERLPWIPGIGADYALGVDGISLLLVLLTTLLGLLTSLASWRAIRSSEREYYALLLLFQTGALGIFLARDSLLFYVFWQAVLVPMYLLIARWGGPRRLSAAFLFLLPNLAGSALMLLGLLALYLWNGPGLLAWRGLGKSWTFSIAQFHAGAGEIPPDLQLWIFLALFLGLAVRVPVFPFQGWLPEVQAEAPAPASAMLGGVLLATGVYGFVRLPLPILPAASVRLLPLMAALSLVGLFAAVPLALLRPDVKKRISHASLAHLGLVMLGLFALNAPGLSGGLLQTVNHGLWTGALFLLLGGVAERRGTCRIAELGGLSAEMPRFAALFLVFTLAAAGVPALNGFVGGLAILLGVFDRVWWWAVLAVLGMVLAAAALLRIHQQVFLGPVNTETRGLPDLTTREAACLLPLVLLCFWIGLYPQPFLLVLDPPVRHLLAQLAKAGS